MNKLLKKDGIAFLTAVALMVILLTMGMSFLATTRTNMTINRNQKDALKALYFAEAGVEHALGEIIANSDTGSDGIGNISSYDLNADSMTDYMVSYNSGTGIISSYGYEGTAYRYVEVEVNTSPWTGAFMVGNRISPAMTLSFSTVTGNVDAVSTIASNFTSQQTIVGTVTPSNSSLTIPTTDLSPTGSYAVSADFTHSDCSWMTNNPAAGVHYVNGNCSYNAGSTGPFSFNGSLIVNGNITIQSVTGGFTITPSGDNPAIVANNTLNLTTLYGVDITGLIYAGGGISLNTWDFFSGHDINGAIVSGGDIGMNTIARTNWVFDSNLNPPYFSGGGGGAVTVVSWKGHP